MRPRKPEKSTTDDLFRSRLDQIIDMKHELVRLADEIDWDWLDDARSGTVAPVAPRKPTERPTGSATTAGRRPRPGS